MLSYISFFPSFLKREKKKCDISKVLLYIYRQNRIERKINRTKNTN